MSEGPGGPARIDAILFDLGGVLIELAGVEQMLAWCPSLSGIDELWRRWLLSSAVRRYEAGGATRAEFAAEIIAEFDLPVGSDAFLEAFATWPRTLFPGATALLAELAPRYRLASVSNTNEVHWERFRREWSLDTHFHDNFPSHQIGKLKPDAEYFGHVIDALGVPAQRVLFVDDNALNVEAAQRLGLVARRVAGVAGARGALGELGLLA
jgi:HAD superfamily hydrolase (TIGR01509 family)